MKDNRKGVAPLIPFLVVVSLIFIGILIFAYVETKRINPQMIEVGRAGGAGLPAYTVETAAGPRPACVGREAYTTKPA